MRPAFVRHSIRARLTVAILATTTIALLVTAVILIVYDYSTYRSAWVGDLTTQSEILARASAPALEFDDPGSAQYYLQLLAGRPRILGAAIYTARGTLFATYRRPGVRNLQFPQLPLRDGVRVEGNRLFFVRRVEGVEGTVGTVFLAAQYQLTERLARYVKIVGAVLLLSLFVALLLSVWMQRTITDPIVGVARLARQVKNRRDFSLRAEKTSADEVGDLVDSINDMLAELGRRAHESERANHVLAQEMATRKEAEVALRAADQRKDEFLASLAHELRNPLAPLRNALEILRLAPHDAAAAEAAREVMDRQLKQLVRLVDDLLDVTRVTTGKLTLRREDVDLAQIVGTVVDASAPFVQANRHQFVVKSPAGTVMLHVDAVRLAQVFVNLIHNATKFTPAGGIIRFELEKDGDHLLATVSDNGVGIPREMLGVIFDMFSQLDRSLERTYAGLGIGLSLARRLVELHGGTLVAESDGHGKGARFIVRLPLDGMPATPDIGIPPAQSATRELVGGD